MCAQSKGDKNFFNRTHELQCLKRLLTSEPRGAGISVIVGPQSSGKTALVQQYVEQLQQDQDSPAQPILINCRVKDVSTPDSFAAALVSSTTSTGQQVRDTLSQVAALVFGNFSARLAPPQLDGQKVQIKLASAAEWVRWFKAEPSSTPLASILEEYTRALRDVRKGTAPPPIIIDEANSLTSWSTEHPTELKTLLRFLVAVTKEQNLTNVLLMTSDYAYIEWLEQGKHTVPLPPDFASSDMRLRTDPVAPAWCAGVGRNFNVKVVGDFVADEAREWFDLLMERTVSNEDWERVFAVSWNVWSETAMEHCDFAP